VKTDPGAAKNRILTPWSGGLALPEPGGPEGNVVCGGLAEIRRLHRAEGLPIKVIARVLGISKNTVKAAFASERPPKYQRPQGGSIVDEVEPGIRELLQAYPRMPATVIAERIGWTRSIRVLSARMAELRPAYLPPDPASRTAYAAGEIAHCDLWFPPIELAVGFWADPQASVVAGADHDLCLFALVVGGADPVDAGAGSVRRVVKADRGVGGGAAGAGVGR
jgi:hypothetical protein